MQRILGSGHRAGTRRLWRPLVLAIGGLLIVAGVLVIALPLVSVWRRGQEDSRALDDWSHGGAQAITGAVGDAHDPGALGGPGCRAASAPPDDYALVNFGSLPQYGYAGVAGEGTWDSLRQRSMVHYRGSAAPGQAGNDVIAFHREPGFQHIDELKVGDTVTVEDRSCRTFKYRITDRQQLSPERVEPYLHLGGSESVLTLVTCTPWYIDSERFVWRASLLPQ